MLRRPLSEIELKQDDVDELKATLLRMGKKFFDDEGNTVEGGPSSFGARTFPDRQRGSGGFRENSSDGPAKRYFNQDGDGAPPKKFHKKFDDESAGEPQSEEKKKLYEGTVEMNSYGYQRKPWQRNSNSNYEPRGGFSGGRGGRRSWGENREDNGEGGGFGGGRRNRGDRREDNGEEGGFGGGRGGRSNWGDRSEDNGEEGRSFPRRRRNWNEEEEAVEEEQSEPKKKLMRWVNVNLRHWRIIIRNLPFQTTKEDLEKACTPFGEFTEVVLPKCKDKKFPKSCAGFGFVQYKTEEDADKALKGLNESKIHGRRIAADWTMPKDTYETAKHEEKEELEKKVKVEKTDEDEKKNEKKGKTKDEKKMEVDDDSDAEEDKDEDMEMEKDHDDSENDDEEKSDEDEEDEEKSDDEDEEGKGKRPPRKEDTAVVEKRVIFLRNLSFQTTDESLKEAMEEYGSVKLAIVCKFGDSGHSKGTGFVHFETPDEANKAIYAANGGELSIDGRSINASLALPKEEATKLDKEKHATSTKDKRNLLLARVGVIREGTAAANGMSKGDAEKRKKQVQSMRKKLENLHMFISPTRLAIHNLPFTLTDDKLRELCEKSAGEGASVVECRIWRDLNNLDEKGVARSRGYGFVAFSSHSSALACLHALNNNATTFTNERRPIVEFSIENLQALKMRESRMGAKAAAKVTRENPSVLKEVTKTTSKMMKAGMKPLPLRMNAKIRTRVPKKKDKKKGGEKKKKEDKGEKKEENGGAKKKVGKSGKKTLAKYLSLST
ncbi:rbm-28 [Pristionchus pacificus]|uniref:Rbm-28 n=1 Tax=Pristionchus pacificus TaxID=54126 RepID=A0A2A6BZD7_PRIPA|nr:rbm-28 [Pristionchus pacificus]|eukprot:PDM71197.1 rbm-28 [Pristionchus pacificus]